MSMLRRYGSAIAAAALAGGLAAACGISADVDDLFSPGNSAATNGAGGQGGATSTTSQATGSPTGGGGAPTTSTTGGGGAGGAGGTAVTTSTSTGGNQVQVFCNGNPCDPGQVCCFVRNNPGATMCGAPGSCQDPAIEISCNEPADCPGGACCGQWDGQTYTGISCQPTCDGFDQILMCEGDANVCPPGSDCFPSMILGDGYSFCQ